MRSDLICLFVLCHCLSQAIFSLNPKSLHFVALQYRSKCMYVEGVSLGDLLFFFFVLYTLHKNRQKFHKKEEEGILLFETKIIPAAKICCLLPPRNYQKRLEKKNHLFLPCDSLYFYYLLLYRDISIHKQIALLTFLIQLC